MEKAIDVPLDVDHSLNGQAHMADYIMIRGKVLIFDDLIHKNIGDFEKVSADRSAFLGAHPFPHLVQDGLFNPELLDLVLDEFPENRASLRAVATPSESTLRSMQASLLGPASQAYFNLIHSNHFVNYLSAVTGIDNLIVDHSLLGGGLHETQRGGKFDIHCDFNRHRRTLLTNRLVLITYLNHDWDTEFGGALELWDAKERLSVRQVEPTFGRTILFENSRISYHGHPEPLAVPPSRSRRSVAAYYYVANEQAEDRARWRSSLFLSKVKGDASRASEARLWFASSGPRKRSARVLRAITPPLIWNSARRGCNATQRLLLAGLRRARVGHLGK